MILKQREKCEKRQQSTTFANRYCGDDPLLLPESEKQRLDEII